MTVSLKRGAPARADEIRRLESEFGMPISESFRRFLSRNNGAKPQDNVFTISKGNSSGVDRFIPVKKILAERENIENIPSKAYPIAWAEGGNYVFIDEGRRGAVFFWDHERPEDIAKLSRDFGEFLASLEPFDTRSVELDPKDVESVWVDPSLLKQLKKQR